MQHIYHKTIQPEPVTKIATDEHIIENITVDEPNSLIACSANENVVLFRAK